LLAHEGSMLFASHDVQFVTSLANRVLELCPDGSYFDLGMTYEQYLTDEARLARHGKRPGFAPSSAA